jgi:hypothetical protein
MEKEEFTERLRDFYKTGQSQQKISFLASMFAVGIGFIVVLFAIVLFLKNPDNITASIVTAISGVVSEFIAAAFFYIHNKNLSQLNVYFEKLIKLQDTNIAIDLVSKMPEEIQSAMRQNIISVLIMRNEPRPEYTPEILKALNLFQKK